MCMYTHCVYTSSTLTCFTGDAFKDTSMPVFSSWGSSEVLWPPLKKGFFYKMRHKATNSQFFFKWKKGFRKQTFSPSWVGFSSLWLRAISDQGPPSSLPAPTAGSRSQASIKQICLKMRERWQEGFFQKQIFSQRVHLVPAFNCDYRDWR